MLRGAARFLPTEWLDGPTKPKTMTLANEGLSRKMAEDITAQNKRYRDLREQIIQELGGSCYFCSSTEDLEFHHVNPDEGHESGIGGRDHLYKVKKDLEDGKQIKPICTSCHPKFHFLLRRATDGQEV